MLSFDFANDNDKAWVVVFCGLLMVSLLVYVMLGFWYNPCPRDFQYAALPGGRGIGEEKCLSCGHWQRLAATDVIEKRCGGPRSVYFPGCHTIEWHPTYMCKKCNATQPLHIIDNYLHFRCQY
jgi:hypothetical protein